MASSNVRKRCIIITAITDNNVSTPTIQDDQEAEGRAISKKRRYRIKKRLKVLLTLLFLAAICGGGYYAQEYFPWRPTAEAQVEQSKPKEEIPVVSTTSVYLYNHKYLNGNLEILGMILNPELQYKTSQYRLVGKDLYIRIQVEPNKDKKLKEFGFKVPCDMNKIKNIYLQGSEEKDKILKWQNP